MESDWCFLGKAMTPASISGEAYDISGGKTDMRTVSQTRIKLSLGPDKAKGESLLKICFGLGLGLIYG